MATPESEEKDKVKEKKEKLDGLLPSTFNNLLILLGARRVGASPLGQDVANELNNASVELKKSPNLLQRSVGVGISTGLLAMTIAGAGIVSLGVGTFGVGIAGVIYGAASYLTYKATSRLIDRKKMNDKILSGQCKSLEEAQAEVKKEKGEKEYPKTRATFLYIANFLTGGIVLPAIAGAVAAVSEIRANKMQSQQRAQEAASLSAESRDKEPLAQERSKEREISSEREVSTKVLSPKKRVPSYKLLTKKTKAPKNPAKEPAKTSKIKSKQETVKKKSKTQPVVGQHTEHEITKRNQEKSNPQLVRQ